MNTDHEKTRSSAWEGDANELNEDVQFIRWCAAASAGNHQDWISSGEERMGAYDVVSPLELATALTAAWLSNPNTRTTTERTPDVLRSLHEALLALGKAPAEPIAEVAHVPATSVRRSLANPERIISMIDGREYASLKRHLTAHGLTPDEYRARYKLRPDYPMIARGYSAKRSQSALRSGLGRKAAAASTGREEGASPESPGEGKKRGKARRTLGIKSAR